MLWRDARWPGRCSCLAPLLFFLAAGDFAGLLEKHVRGLHRHAAEVRDEVCAVSVAGDVAFRAPSSVLAAEGEHVTAVAAPVGTNIRDRFEPMGNTVVDFLRIVVLEARTDEISEEVNVDALTPVFDFDIHFVTTLS